MPDRLNELLRQRALVSEHLAWLDREIARANSAPAAAPAPIGAPAAPFPSGSTVAGVSLLPAAEVIPAVASSTPGSAVPVERTLEGSEEILDQYRVSAKAVHQDVRKGCLLYFVGAFVALGIVIAVLYFTISSR